ncbi:hypothetical protein MLD38_021537 [Melastoma candidum]|uniref:Uncharacterized protein n=1 Tax=Melastoma candidum TaxID=119954 RepID=A0ACB9QGD7_9MYRT|nr:hypothetical protein MLD38_021537 [Melastoma candidum]
MSRIGRNAPLSHHRVRSLTAIPDENLDLFSRNRYRISLTSSDDSSDASSSIKLGRLSVGSAKVARSGIDDLLLSTSVGGKHDYDWLLTPPGTPLFPSSDGPAAQPAKGVSVARSASPAKASRLSVSQSETTHTSRPTRSCSVTRASVSTSHCSSYSSIRSSTSILNTSSASVSSYTRPSSPLTRSSTSARPSSPSAHSTVSRSSTPSRVHTTPRNSSTERPRPSHSSRPSTPSSRAQISAGISSPAAPRQSSRPSTPTQRSSNPSSPFPTCSTAMSQAIQNGRISASSSRPGSPSSRPRASPHSIIPPDFPLETPPNLRTTLPDRPLSAGRSRPGAAVMGKGSHDNTTPTSLARRQSSPAITRGWASSTEANATSRVNSYRSDATKYRKPLNSPDLGTRQPVKNTTSSPTDRTGFGRSFSKNSMDMEMRHMYVKNCAGGIRALSGTTLFPQSIRTSPSKTQPNRSASGPTSVNTDNTHHDRDYTFLKTNNGMRTRAAGNRMGPNQWRTSAKVMDLDIYESTRYDAMLLREDAKNTNWLHSVDEKSDQGSVFENGLEFLPEPFDPL